MFGVFVVVLPFPVCLFHFFFPFPYFDLVDVLCFVLFFFRVLLRPSGIYSLFVSDATKKEINWKAKRRERRKKRGKGRKTDTAGQYLFPLRSIGAANEKKYTQVGECVASVEKETKSINKNSVEEKEEKEKHIAQLTGYVLCPFFF